MGCADPSMALNAYIAAGAGQDMALNAYMAADWAGQDMYNAFLSSAAYACPPPAPVQQQAELPPGIVVPKGFKLVPATGSAQDMPGYPGSRPSSNMNNDRQAIDSVPESDKKRAPLESKKFNADSGKVFVGGLTSATTADTLRGHFSKFGKIVGASVISDPVTKRGRGFGFVEFEGEIPAVVLESNHVIDKRRCGVKPYSYEWSYVS
jgi:hypothetical protein